MAWNTNTTPVVAEASITVNGSRQSLNDSIGESFGAVVIEAARNADMGKFRVILDGDEIKPEDAPATIEAGMEIELRPYDVAGLVMA